ncbi:RNA ligase family protein [Thermoflavimicrobium daqui]|uniref:DNA ligase n=1 Tax=Thermoflavimicrobium daqui TaxID=2137476 RepID=A0A364K821_9BACL|nr:RNA ligase family protein [Thermoflavimicrobium daqui]RAL26444.1 DNA ligase [Thermoflavimicrobium daqui]
MTKMIKYPRTPHIEGSGLQQGDNDLNLVPYSTLKNAYLVIEEKMDGANCGISFTSDGQLRLQSRGHYLTGGPREQQFHLLKSWANRYTGELWYLLGDRYILYGEWMYAKHTIFYTDLPHYFLEFDIYDQQEKVFLSTKARRDLLKSAPFIVSVKVLYEGAAPSYLTLKEWIGPSHFISHDLIDQLCKKAIEQGISPDTVLKETDLSGLMEGLYIKEEEGDMVKGRYKFVRSDFLQTIIDSESHWMNRQLLPNQLRKGVTLF